MALALQWSDLALPWQACWEEGWNAFLAGSLFIGAVVTRPTGEIVVRGRNHIHDTNVSGGQVGANQLAHAELNALLALGLGHSHVRTYHIYTLVEPCPLCLGAIYMSGVRNIHYAARDPWAGSTNLLGATPYLAHKRVPVEGPPLPALETAVTALGMCREIRRRVDFYETPMCPAYQRLLPQGLLLAQQLAQDGRPYAWRLAGLSASQVFEKMMELC